MLYAIVAVIAIILDQVIKYLVETHVVLDAMGDDLVRLIPGFIHITNVHNLGGAFNLLQGARWLFIIVCVLFVAIVVYVLARGVIKTPLARWMAVFVTAGAVGNCIDRIICGYVVDMFEFEFFRFPVFNLADILITVGAIVFCLCVLFEKPKTEAADKPAPERAEPDAKPAPKQPRRAPAAPSHRLNAADDAHPFDPNAPFAEWEKPKPEPEAEAAPEKAPEKKAGPVVYSRPAAAPEAPAPEAPAPDGGGAEPESFSIDDILAEFRDP